jgi:hypothetical protein
MTLNGNIRKKRNGESNIQINIIGCELAKITGDFAHLDVEFVKLLYSVSRDIKPTCLLDGGKINIFRSICMKKVHVLINKINPIVTGIIEAELYEKIMKGFFFYALMSGVQSEWFKRTVNKTLVATRDKTLIKEAYKQLILTLLNTAFCFIITVYILSVLVIVGKILPYRIQLIFHSSVFGQRIIV